MKQNLLHAMFKTSTLFVFPGATNQNLYIGIGSRVVN